MEAIKTIENALTGMLPEELYSHLSLDKPFRAKQIFSWIAAGEITFDQMTNISATMRKHWEQKETLYSTKITKTCNDPDGTIKLQITCADGAAIETVLLIDHAGRKTACVSCQVGCPMNCAFCQTGHLGYTRNLLAGEIVEQFLHLERQAGKLDSIVFMGMGEPMLNLDAIRKTITILTHPEGRGLSKRRITISTCGLSDGIRSLADDGPDIRLAVSLTTANEQLRNELMPVTRTHPLNQLKEAISYFSKKTGKRVTLEAALMGGINTTEKNAEELAKFSQGLSVHINLIPWNAVPELRFTTPSSAETAAFVRMLESRGLNVTLRTRRGRSIGGACGQLGKKQPNYPG